MTKDEAMKVIDMKISYFPHSTLTKNIYRGCTMCNSVQSEDNFCANCVQRLDFSIESDDIIRCRE